MIDATADIWIHWNCPECGRRLTEVMNVRELAARYSDTAVIVKTHNAENALGEPCRKEWFTVKIEFPNITVGLYTQ